MEKEDKNLVGEIEENMVEEGEENEEGEEDENFANKATAEDSGELNSSGVQIPTNEPLSQFSSTTTLANPSPLLSSSSLPPLSSTSSSSSSSTSSSSSSSSTSSAFSPSSSSSSFSLPPLSSTPSSAPPLSSPAAFLSRAKGFSQAFPYPKELHHHRNIGLPPFPLIIYPERCYYCPDIHSHPKVLTEWTRNLTFADFLAATQKDMTRWLKSHAVDFAELTARYPSLVKPKQAFLCENVVAIHNFDAKDPRQAHLFPEFKKICCILTR